jgi:hypothetical protein
MCRKRKILTVLGAAVLIVLTACNMRLDASDRDLVPPQLPREQRDNLLHFLEQHAKPERYVPADAKVIGSQPAGSSTVRDDSKPAKPIKQYTVQIILHRPVPGQEEVKLVDVYYYRPNPEAGKPGITVKHTVDLTSGKQVGQTEVLLQRHTPLSREELAEAVDLAREKSAELRALYKGRDKNAVRWEYLQVMINRKHEGTEPGDRVVRLVFTASSLGDQPAPGPVRIIVNLTKGIVATDSR